MPVPRALRVYSALAQVPPPQHEHLALSLDHYLLRVLVLAPNPGRVVGCVEVPIPRSEHGRDRYDAVFKSTVAKIENMSSVCQMHDEPPLDLFRLARVDGI